MGWISTAVAIIALIRQLKGLLEDFGWDISKGFDSLTKATKKARECKDVNCLADEIKKIQK